MPETAVSNSVWENDLEFQFRAISSFQWRPGAQRQCPWTWAGAPIMKRLELEIRNWNKTKSSHNFGLQLVEAPRHPHLSLTDSLTAHSLFHPVSCALNLVKWLFRTLPILPCRDSLRLVVKVSGYLTETPLT